MSDEGFMGNKLKVCLLLKVRGSCKDEENKQYRKLYSLQYGSGNTDACLVVLSCERVLLRILETMIWDGKKLANWTLESILVSSIIIYFYI